MCIKQQPRLVENEVHAEAPERRLLALASFCLQGIMAWVLLALAFCPEQEHLTVPRQLDESRWHCDSTLIQMEVTADERAARQDR